MNLRARNLGLIVLSALSLFSCEEDINTIGLPPENNLGIFFAEVPLGDKTKQIWVDNVTTSGTGVIMVGAYEDPHFGLIEAKNYAEISYAAHTFDASATFDSVVFQGRITALAGTSIEDVEHSFEIFQLADTINVVENGEARQFRSNSTEPIGSQIGEMNFQLYPDSVGLSFEDTDIDLNDDVNDAADSAFFDKYFDSNQLYIYLTKTTLDETFGQNIFNQLRTNQYDSAGELAALFKGVHIRPKTTSGAIVNYSTTDSGLVFYFTEDGEQKSVRYPISARSYNNISPNTDVNWMGSDFDELSSFYTPLQTATNKAYLQSGSNLLLNIDLSSLQNFKDTLDNAVIQSAELLITGMEETSTFSPPANITYWLSSLDSLASENYQVSVIRNNSGSQQVSTYDSEENRYRAEIPLFLESFTSGESEFDQLIISPIAVSSSGAISLPRSSVSRFVTDKSNLKIRLYYTIPDNQNQ